MAEHQKIRIFLADDQFGSGIQKLQTFFSYTEAPLRTEELEAEKTKHLKITGDYIGAELGFLSPEQVFAIEPESAKNAIFLIDLNWSHGRMSIPNAKDLSDEQIETYGYRLIEHLLEQLGPDSNSWIVVYSESKADIVSDYYDAWMDRGISTIRQVVDPYGERIADRAWKCYASIVKQLIVGLSGSIVGEMNRLHQKVDPNERMLVIDDFVGSLGNHACKGFQLQDLALPFLERIERLRREPNKADEVRQTYDTWFEPFSARTLSFEIPENPANLATKLVQEILRYGKLHFLDGILYFRDTNKRWAKPAPYLDDWLDSNGNLIPKKSNPIPLRESFARLFQIHLGSMVDAGKYPAGFPTALEDNKYFSVQRERGNKDALFYVEKHWPVIQLREREDIAVANTLIQVRKGLDDVTDENVVDLLRLFDADGNNLDLLLNLAKGASVLVDKNNDIEPALLTRLRKQWSLWAQKLRDARNALNEYREQVRVFTEAEIQSYGKSHRSIKLLEDCKDAPIFIKRWESQEEQLTAAISCLDKEVSPEASIGELLIEIGNESDSTKLQHLVKSHFKPLLFLALKEALRNLSYRAKGVRDKGTFYRKLKATASEWYPENDFERTLQSSLVPLRLTVVEMQSQGYSPAAFSTQQIRPFLAKQIEQQMIDYGDLLDGQSGEFEDGCRATQM